MKPQVTFASLSSPAVMDIRRLRRRLLEKKINYIKIPPRGTKLQIVSIVSIVFKTNARKNAKAKRGF